MPDTHLRRFLAEHPWAIVESYLMVLADVFERRLLGERLSDADIQARIGTKKADRQDDGFALTPEGVAVLPLHGVISHRMNLLSAISGGTSTDQFGRAFQALVDSKDVKAIVLDVDSPGGSVYGLDELHGQMMEARGKKPIVAHVSPLAASAAYWIASAADRVVVTPSGDVGSVGVFAVHQERSKQEAEDGVTTTVIRAGKYKAEGNPHEPLTDEAKQAMQERVDAAYDRFISALSTGFGRSAPDIKEKFGQGRVVGAKEALKLGMVHEVGTFAQTLQRVASGVSSTRAHSITSNASATSQEPMKATDQERVPYSVWLARTRLLLGDL
jgi:capsid assembly protease